MALLCIVGIAVTGLVRVVLTHNVVSKDFAVWIPRYGLSEVREVVLAKDVFIGESAPYAQDLASTFFYRGHLPVRYEVFDRSGHCVCLVRTYCSGIFSVSSNFWQRVPKVFWYGNWKDIGANLNAYFSSSRVSSVERRIALLPSWIFSAISSIAVADRAASPMWRSIAFDCSPADSTVRFN